MNLTTTETYDICENEALTEKVKGYVLNAKSKETRRGYRSDWNQFELWCKEKNLRSMPADVSTIAAYLSDLANIKKVATIQRRLVSIKQAHSAAGYPIYRNNSLITETVKGIKKTHGAPQRAKTPLLTKDIHSMILNLGDDLQGTRDKAILLLGYTGAFRRSELVAFNVDDLNFKFEGIEVLVRRSKTDQEGKGQVVPIPYGSNPITCPVRAIQKWIERSNIVEGPLFRAINKHAQISAIGMCSASVGVIVKRNDFVMKSDGDYSAHSLRAGFCTQVAANGVTDTQGMRHSRHTNFNTWRKYVRLATIWQDSAATKLGL